MQTSNKAKKATIIYNGIELEAYQLPNGEYNLSKTQVGKAIEKLDSSVQEWLSGKSPEALPYKDHVFQEVSIEGRNTTFNSVPLNVAAAYWTYWAQKGNTVALALVSTSVVESLTRLCNNAFGVKNNESEIQSMNVSNFETNRMLFEMLNTMQKFGEQIAETNRKLDDSLKESAQLKVEKKELEEFKENVETYPEFLYLLESAKNEVLITDFQDGVSCKGYLTQNNIPLDRNYWCTLSRRVASYYRSTKGHAPERRGNHNIYRSTNVAYIVAILRLLMKGK